MTKIFNKQTTLSSFKNYKNVHEKPRFKGLLNKRMKSVTHFYLTTAKFESVCISARIMAIICTNPSAIFIVKEEKIKHSFLGANFVST